MYEAYTVKFIISGNLEMDMEVTSEIFFNYMNPHDIEYLHEQLTNAGQYIKHITHFKKCDSFETLGRIELTEYIND